MDRIKEPIKKPYLTESQMTDHSLEIQLCQIFCLHCKLSDVSLYFCVKLTKNRMFLHPPWMCVQCHLIASFKSISSCIRHAFKSKVEQPPRHPRSWRRADNLTVSE
ncbi:hypothetical protein ILYODFUR_013328 [Ilyodon furcidens]|uniref:Uncharacterized protein n=1 Tax=Ilyodon furcidens TaxID=33524 RepID=A0ABV0SYC7_9TELE